MAKNIEELANMNAILQARIHEQSRATTVDPEIKESRNGQIGRHEESNWEEWYGEREEEREAMPKNPPHTEAEKIVKSMILKLEQTCDLLTETV